VAGYTKMGKVGEGPKGFRKAACGYHLNGGRCGWGVVGVGCGYSHPTFWEEIEQCGDDKIGKVCSQGFFCTFWHGSACNRAFLQQQKGRICSPDVLGSPQLVARKALQSLVTPDMTKKERWLVTTAFDRGVGCGHLLQKRFQARKEYEQGANKGKREYTGKGKPLMNRQTGRKNGDLITLQAEGKGKSLTTGVQECEDHDEQEDGLQQRATDAEQLSDSTILTGGKSLGEGDMTFVEQDTEIVFDTPGKSGGGGFSSSSQVSPISTRGGGGAGAGSPSSSSPQQQQRQQGEALKGPPSFSRSNGAQSGRLVLAGSSAVGGRGRGQGWGKMGPAIGFAGGRGGRGRGGWPGGMVGQKKRDDLMEKRREEQRIQKGKLLGLEQNEGRDKVEVEDGRKGDAVDGEGKRGDVEKVYCSGSTAGRDHGLAWLFGEQEDGDGAEQQNGSKEADESGAPSEGEDSSGDSRMVGPNCNTDDCCVDLLEKEDDEYGRIVERLMTHWVGLAVKGKIPWSAVRRRWFGLIALQNWDHEGHEPGGSLWESEDLRRTWLGTEYLWQDALDDYMGPGAREGWEGHCEEHGCCGQEENGEWSA